MSFKIRYLALAVAATTPILSNAAGLDRSTQPSWAFTQDGTFAYVERVTIDPKITGKDMSGNKVPDMAEDYNFLNYGAKADINNRVSIGAFFDQPWGANVAFSGNNNFVAPANLVMEGVFAQIDSKLVAQGKSPTNVKDLTQASTFVSTKQAELAAGQQQLAQGELQYQQGLKDYELAPTKLAAAKQQIDAGQATLDAAVPLLTAGQQKVNEGKAGLEELTTNPELLQFVPSLASNDQQVKDATSLAQVQQIIGLGAILHPDKAAEYQAKAAKIGSYIDGSATGQPITTFGGLRQEIAKGEALLAQKQAEYNAGLAQLEAGKKSYQQGLTDYQNAPTKLAEAQAKLEAGKKQITEGEQSLAAFKQAVNGIQQMMNAKGATKVDIKSQSFTGVLGLKFGDKNQFQVYGGPMLQKVEGNVSLRGNAYKGSTAYNASIPNSSSMGWMGGIAYSKPEIALKAALTYRSKIKHKDVPVAESLPLLAVYGLPNETTSNMDFETPESVNLDFQTGLNHTTLLTAKVHYVPWSKFQLTPNLYHQATMLDGTHPNGLPLVSYDKDGWTVELGLGKKLSDKWAVSPAIGWDSGAGNPTTSLGPVKGNWNVGLGARYNITPEWSISGGAKYLVFGDAKAKIPDDTIVGNFQNNDGFVYGIRLAYQKK